MKEQEDYFDRKITERLKYAGADAPLSWPEMQELLEKSSRRSWLGWYGFFFAVLLGGGLLFYVYRPSGGSLLPGEATPVAVVQQTQESAPAAFNGFPSAPSAAGKEPGWQDGSQAPSAEYPTGRKWMLQNGHSGPRPAENNAGSAGINPPASVPAASIGRGGEPVLHAAKRQQLNRYHRTHHAAALQDMPPADISSARQNPATKEAVALNTVSDNRILSGEEPITRMRRRELLLRDPVFPAALPGINTKAAPQLQEDALLPAVISVFGTMGIEYVNYQSLLSPTEQVNFQQSWQAGNGFGMLLGYGIKKHWSLHLGIEYTRRETGFVYKTLALQRRLEIDTGMVEVQGPDSTYFVTTYDTTVVVDKTPVQLDYSAGVSVVSVPLLLHYTVVSGRWLLLPFAGVEYNARTTYRLIRKFDEERFVVINEAGLKETQSYLSVRGGFKVVHRLSQQLDVFGGLDGRYLLPLSSDKINGGGVNILFGIMIHR